MEENLIPASREAIKNSINEVLLVWLIDKDLLDEVLDNTLKANFKQIKGENTIGGTFGSLVEMFYWDKTPQGGEYWRQVDFAFRLYVISLVMSN